MHRVIKDKNQQIDLQRGSNLDATAEKLVAPQKELISIVRFQASNNCIKLDQFLQKVLKVLSLSSKIIFSSRISKLLYQQKAYLGKEKIDLKAESKLSLNQIYKHVKTRGSLSPQQ